MIGIVFTIIGAVATYRLWGDHKYLAILTIIATLFQLSSLFEMLKEVHDVQPEDRIQIVMNIISTVIIVAMFILSFII